MPTSQTLLANLTVVLSLLACGSRQVAPVAAEQARYEYDFSSPVTEIELPGRLEEISGLTFVGDSIIAAIQDEKGEIFLVNYETGVVVDEFRFGKKGDFEGIELVGDTMYVLRSDGDLYVITNWQSEDRDDDKIETYLATKNDTEGLGYQRSHHRLLIAAKEFPGRGRSRVRSIYGFDLKTQRLDPDPVYTIPLDTIGTRLGLPGEAIRSFLAPILDLEGFKPSAIAVHPRTGDIFVLSSVLKVIAVLLPSGELDGLYPVTVDNMPQPEGLAFLPNGDLLIATEGAGGDGRIFRFNESGTAK
jgi:uncharacterized protein YjiK